MRWLWLSGTLMAGETRSQKALRSRIIKALASVSVIGDVCGPTGAPFGRKVVP